MTHESSRNRLVRGSRTASIVVALGMLALGGAGIAAQDATPADAGVQVSLLDVDGNEAGSATFTEADGSVTIDLTVEGLEPGDHGIHIHETGACDPAGDMPFSTAGDHFNPTDTVHGPGPDPASAGTPVAAPEAHAGDLSNITIADDGTGMVSLTTDRVTLASGDDNSLPDSDGSALVIHADPDDLTTDPSGNSGGRIVCGVIFAAMEGTPEASGEEGVAATGAMEPVEALDSLVFAPSTVTVSPGDTIQSINTGALEHDFVVEELDISVDLPSGQLVDIQIPEDAVPGEYEFYCSVPGHAPAGMVGTLIVE
ncbi:MAG: superoxide dismutase family protein [Chloroflexia bacterium]|nr:superoxide dismutase family protein [Chloroflexia bacterium]